MVAACAMARRPMHMQRACATTQKPRIAGLWRLAVRPIVVLPRGLEPLF